MVTEQVYCVKVKNGQYSELNIYVIANSYKEVLDFMEQNHKNDEILCIKEFIKVQRNSYKTITVEV
jgi:predicted nucleic-acid-binding Zn-ribbon protein